MFHDNLCFNQGQISSNIYTAMTLFKMASGFKTESNISYQAFAVPYHFWQVLEVEIFFDFMCYQHYMLKENSFHFHLTLYCL